MPDIQLGRPVHPVMPISRNLLTDAVLSDQYLQAGNPELSKATIIQDSVYLRSNTVQDPSYSRTNDVLISSSESNYYCC